MIIDCDRCAVRGDACQDCVIGVLLRAPETVSDTPPDTPYDAPYGGPPDTRFDTDPDDQAAADGPSGASIVQLDAPERRALEVLADQGLVPRLRLVATTSRHAPPQSGRGGTKRDAG